MMMNYDKNHSIANVLIDSTWLYRHLYTVRNKKVMLDSDLACLYGYTTKSFNQQVKNNSERFDDGEFMFQLTENEVEDLRSNFLTANISEMRRTPPYVFTEQGIYMLMTVLKGSTAVQQSKTLVKLFKQMKDYIITTGQQELLLEYNSTINSTFNRLNSVEKAIEQIEIRLENTVTKSDLSMFFDQFDIKNDIEGFVLYQGQWFTADKLFYDLFSSAKHLLVIVDPYVSINTVNRLIKCKKNVEILIYTKNIRELPKDVFKDFVNEFHLNIQIVKVAENYCHDRFIGVDIGYEKNEKTFIVGSSIKDTGKSMTMIIQSKMVRDVIGKIIVDCKDNEILLTSGKI